MGYELGELYSDSVNTVVVVIFALGLLLLLLHEYGYRYRTVMKITVARKAKGSRYPKGKSGKVGGGYIIIQDESNPWQDLMIGSRWPFIGGVDAEELYNRLRKGCTYEVVVAGWFMGYHIVHIIDKQVAA